MAVARSPKSQQLVSALWISAGVIALALFTHDWDVSSRSRDGWLAPIEFVARAAEFCYGWTCIWLGIIPLISTSRHRRMLALAAAMTFMGVFVGSAFGVAHDAGSGDPRYLLVATSLFAFASIPMLRACRPNGSRH
jgi:uncharacterized membrane protein